MSGKSGSDEDVRWAVVENCVTNAIMARLGKIIADEVGKHLASAVSAIAEQVEARIRGAGAEPLACEHIPANRSRRLERAKTPRKVSIATKKTSSSSSKGTTERGSRERLGSRTPRHVRDLGKTRTREDRAYKALIRAGRKNEVRTRGDFRDEPSARGSYMTPRSRYSSPSDSNDSDDRSNEETKSSYSVGRFMGITKLFER